MIRVKFESKIEVIFEAETEANSKAKIGLCLKLELKRGLKLKLGWLLKIRFEAAIKESSITNVWLSLRIEVEYFNFWYYSLKGFAFIWLRIVFIRAHEKLNSWLSVVESQVSSYEHFVTIQMV